MKQKQTHALVVSIFLMILTFGIGIFGAIMAILINDRGAQIYFAFFALTWFWCGTLMLMVTYRIASIKPTQIDNNNVNCFTDWRVFFCSIFFSSDFQFQNYIAICLILTLFHTTLSLMLQQNYSSGLQIQLNEFILPSKAIFIISLVLGGLLHLKLFYNLVYMFVSYQGYQHIIIYQIHLKQTMEEEIKFKKSITYKSILFCIILSLYYILKIILYSIILQTHGRDKNIVVSATIGLISNIPLIILFTKTCKQLTNMLKDVAAFCNSETSCCFIGWGALMKTLIFQKQNCFILAVVVSLLVLQVVYGLMQYPFYHLYQLPLLKTNNEILYIYFDTATLSFIILWQLVDFIARYFNNIQIDWVSNGFTQKDNAIVQILPQNQTQGSSVVNEKSEIVRLSYVCTKEEVALKDIGNCCICLDKMKDEQQIYQSKCHSCHVFHYSCISQWVISHNHCPLCQKAIY